MDVEGFLLSGGSRKTLLQVIRTYKNLSARAARKLVEAIEQEIANASKRCRNKFINELLATRETGVTAGTSGLGCRGRGDFLIHKNIGELFGRRSVLSPAEQDDAGAVKLHELALVIAIDGMHSRLSEYPFIAGFHAARAAVRDVVVKNAEPLAMFVDIHLADDADVAKLFDFLAGVKAVSQLVRAPVIAGSTLRIGGDMVIGRRICGFVGCAGVASELKKRSGAKPGDAIVMTQGSGGGTISTTAIYAGKKQVVARTLHIDSIRAWKALKPLACVHAMLDVTNGGIRGDAHELLVSTGLGMEIDARAFKSCIDREILNMLEELRIDVFGVSIDSILAFTDEPDKVISALKRIGIKARVIGKVIKGENRIIHNRVAEPLEARFKEAPYTQVKKLVENQALSMRELERSVLRAKRNAEEKCRKVVELVRKRYSG